MEGKTENGFTLIELSIVLVIIGLIVGGILLGQDLIKAAELRAQVGQIEKYRTAVNAFRTKYNGLPGDLNVSDATALGFTVGTACTGQFAGRDGNGLLDGITNAIYALPVGETQMFWEDLSFANLIDGHFPGPGTGVSAANCFGSWDILMDAHFPKARIGYANYIYVYEAKNANWFALSHLIIQNAANVGDANLPVIAASNIDTKMDDGYPTTGSVVAVYPSGDQVTTTVPANGSTPSSSTCYDTSSGKAAYSLINQGSGLNCALSFRFQ